MREVRVTSLVDFRVSKNISQSEMAKILGCSLSLYSKVETGIRKPSYDFLLKLKEAFPEIDTNIFFIT